MIYPVGDDVKDLLSPFLEKNGGTKDILKIERLYNSASLGNMFASEFWKGAEISLELEDEYLPKA